MESPEVRANIHEIRMGELEAAVAVIGYDELVLLGYRDSGMPDTPSNGHPDSFAQADLDEATGRLVAVIRRTRPQVILTYAEDQRGYRHPDHLRVYEISAAAFEAAGDPARYPDQGAPFQPLKMYSNGSVREQFVQRHEKFLELGLESPYAERFEAVDRGPQWSPNLTPTAARSRPLRLRTRPPPGALIAHATQIDPTSKNWFGLPEEAELSLHHYDYFTLVRSLVGPIETEDDLFAGVRDLVAR